VSTYKSTGWHILHHSLNMKIHLMNAVGGICSMYFAELGVSTVSTNGLKVSLLLWMAELVIHSIKHAWRRPDVVNRPEWGSHFIVPPLPRCTKWFHFPTRPAGRQARWVMGTRRQLSLSRAGTSFKWANWAHVRWETVQTSRYKYIYILCVSVGEWVSVRLRGLLIRWRNIKFTSPVA
jgi:hypothetical protein